MKKILLSLLGIFVLGFVNFGSCDFIIGSKSFYNFSSSVDFFEVNVDTGDIVCIYPYQNSWSSSDIKIAYLSGGFDNNSNLFNGTIYANNLVCLNQSFGVKNYSSNTSKGFYGFSGIGSLNSVLNSQLSSCESDLSIMSGDLSSCQFDLSISDGKLLDCQGDLSIVGGELNSCQSDYLSCSQSLGNCGTSLNSCQNSLGDCMIGNVGTGINWSSLFINGIQHDGKPLINIDIPAEINWDYINSGSSFDLFVNGYNQDTEYIDNIIRLQNYKPTSEDFTELINVLTPYSKILIFCVFLFIVWAWIKKPFKSKKI